MSPRAIVPDEQQSAFRLALAEYLGIDPTRFVLSGWEVGDNEAHVELKAPIPPDDLLFMFNHGRVP